MNNKSGRTKNGEPSAANEVAPSSMTSRYLHQPTVSAGSRRVRAHLFALLLLPACSQEIVLIPIEPEESDQLPTATRAEVDAACSGLCSGSFDCQVWEGFCETNCESVIIEGCEAEAKAIIDCLDRLAPEECSLTTLDCLKEVVSLSECAPLSYCGSSAILTLPDGCSSSGLCGGDILTQNCIDDPINGGSKCSCYFGDKLVKDCDYTNSSCGFEYGCCATVPL